MREPGRSERTFLGFPYKTRTYIELKHTQPYDGWPMSAPVK